MDDLEERFSVALHDTARSWRQTLDRRLKYSGVSHAGWLTIAAAAKATAPLSQSELADRLAVEGATMVAMIDRLVKAGFMAREPSTTDRRIKHVVLTEAGRRLYDVVKMEAVAARRELLANIDGRKLAAATEVLETLQSVMDAIP